MTGFIKNYAHKEVIMECFPPELVPAMSTLASEFALFDRWYSSVPGPTEVNRMFLYSATSDGSANNDDVHLALGYPQRTIFENIDESKYNRTWGVYFQEAPSVFFMSYVRTEENLKKFHSYEKFLEDAKAGTLPSFTFLEPNYSDLPGKPATDQHPDHDVGLGDQLIKEIYEAVRNGPLWNESLLLITYDEHGGFFDHVPPPINIPSPDGKVSHDSNPSFDFTRSGVRVPAIAISPWIKKGLLVHEPGNNTHYEHSSLSATLLKLLTPDQTFLTKRDAWAAPFDWLVDTVDTLRTDCPTELPTAPTERENGILLPLDQIGSRPLTPLQRSLVRVASGLKNNGVITHDGEGMSEADGAYFLRDRVNEWLGREVVNFHRPAEAAPVLSQA
jgi:phospholipase C